MGEPEVYSITKLIDICIDNGVRKHRANLRGDRVSPLLNLSHLRGLQVFDSFIRKCVEKHLLHTW